MGDCKTLSERQTDRYTNVQTDIHIDVGTDRQIVDTYVAQTGRLPIKR
jgi:hypothetical protein